MQARKPTGRGQEERSGAAHGRDTADRADLAPPHMNRGCKIPSRERWAAEGDRRHSGGPEQANRAPHNGHSQAPRAPRPHPPATAVAPTAQA
jgi:hypothetical protein